MISYILKEKGGVKLMKVNKTFVGVLVGVLAVATVLDLKYKGAGYKMLPESVQSIVDSIL